ncbi:MAG: Ig-like domain-containing protein [Ilumatobacteraceae bacterium]
MKVLVPQREQGEVPAEQNASSGEHRWAERPALVRVLKLLVMLGPIVVSVAFVAVASRVVPRPAVWYGVVGWWIALTLVSTVVLALTERVMRKFLPLVALFNLSLVFPDHSPSRFKIAMRTNTLRQLQRTLEQGELVGQVDFQEAAERLVALAGALNSHDRMTRGHTERVRAYTLMIGEELHLPKADLDRLHWAGLVHDIGKLEVPPSILNKPGRPDEDEWEVLKQHPAAGVRLVEPLRPWLGEWADATSQHHERWDGKGYPLGLAGEQISLSGRIVAVADAFDVMTSVRSYKKAMTPDVARAELLRCAGTQFDANVVRAFLNISVGKLRLVMGPLSWLAQAPALGNVPIGTAAVTAASSLISVAVAVAGGLTGGSPTTIPAAPVIASAPVPVASTMVLTGLEDQRLELDVSAFADAPPTTMSITSVPPHLAVDPTSSRALIPDQNWYGHTTGEYRVCWDTDCSTARLDIDVQPVNDVPIANADGATTPQGTAVTIDVLANDSDVEDGAPTLASVRLDPTTIDATATIDSDKTVSFEPGPGFVGTAHLQYEIADSEGATAMGMVTIEVTPVDSPPRAADDNVTVHAGATEVIDVLSNDTDFDHDPLTIVSVTPPRVGEVVLSANNVTFHAPADGGGQTTFTYTIEDSSGGRGRATVYISILDDAPPPPTTVLPLPPTPNPRPTANDDRANLAEDSPAIDIDLLSNDTSADGDFTNDTISLTDPPGLGTAQVIGKRLRYQPAPDANGVDTLTYQLCEHTNACDTASVTIVIAPINDPPQFVDTGAVNLIEDQGAASVAGWAHAISAGPLNEGAENVGFTVVVDQPAMFATLPFLDSNGTLGFTPAADANGAALITVTAVDDGGTSSGGRNTSSPHTATINIAAVNDAPQFTDSGSVTVVEDAGPTSISGWASSIRPGPANESAQQLTFTVQVDQPTMFSSVPTIDAAGTLTFTPAPNANGTATIVATVSDNAGTGNGGVDTSVSHTATITITAVNDPVVATADAATVNEDTPAGVTIVVLANDTDADGDALVVAAIDASAINGGTVTDLGSGSFNYTPAANFNGTETFTYTVTDGNGSTAAATVTITVVPVPDAPVATADAFSTAEDTPRVVAAPGVMGNDYDEDGDALTISASPLTGPANGSVTISADGAFTYSPTTGFVGTDSFTYQLNDGTGLTSTGTVTITVDSGLTTGGLYLGTTQSFGTWNMTIGAPANATPEPDYDLDGHPGITVAKDGALGTRTWVRGIAGSPLALNGPATLELWSTIENFRLNKDGHPDITLYDCNSLGFGCITVGHTAIHMNDYNGATANWVKIDLSLGNVTHTFAIGRQLRLQIKEGHNDLWIAASGTRPSRLTYTVANAAPVANNDTAPAILEDPAGPTNIDVLANDTDNNLDATTVSIVSAPTKGIANPQPDGSINYQPNPNANGADSFTYRVCDTGGFCSTATVSITINPVNDRPTFTAGPDVTVTSTDPAYTQAGWATGITAGPANESAQSLTFTVTAADPSLFTVQPSLSASGTLTFTLSGSPGTTSITVHLADNGGTANGGNNAAIDQTATITII